MAENTNEVQTLPVDKNKDEEILKSAQMDEQEMNDDVGLIIDDDDIPDQNQEIPTSNEEEVHEPTNGFVLDHKIEPKKVQPKGVQAGPLNSEQRKGEIDKALSDMNAEIEEQRRITEERIAKGDAPRMKINDPDAPDAVKKNNDRLDEETKKKESGESDEEKESDELDPTADIKIIIDKSGMGKFEFTEEEKKRIATSKRIHLVEVEDKDLGTLNITKNIKGKKDLTILKRNFNKSYSRVLALASGYTCKMKNLSAAEALRMYQPLGNDTPNSILDKWSVIYDKITDVSVGEFKDFDDFCKNTAFQDYDAFLHAMISSSYPNDDSIQFNCDKERGGCGKDFSIAYDNQHMLRESSITPGLKAHMVELINASAFIEKAKEVQANAPVHRMKRVRLDTDSNIIVEFYAPSVYEMVENTLKVMESHHELTNDENRNLVYLAQYVKNIYVPDYEAMETSDEISYYAVSDLTSMVTVLKQLNEIQLRIIATRANDLNDDYLFRFGFDKVECPHCGHDWGEYNMSLDQILFQRAQQRVTTEID